MPVGVEVRLASSRTSTSNLSCAKLIAARVRGLLPAAVADPRLERRQRGLAAAGPGRHRSRAAAGPRRRVLRRAARRRRHELQLRRERRRGLGHARRREPRTYPANFRVERERRRTLPTVRGITRRRARRTEHGDPSRRARRQHRDRQLDWADTTPQPQLGRRRSCRNGGNNPCKYSGTDGHRDLRRHERRAGAVALVDVAVVGRRRTAVARSKYRPLGLAAPTATHGAAPRCTIYPTVGIRARPQGRRLRDAPPATTRRGTSSLRCDPNLPQGQEFSAFHYGCEPWYGAELVHDPNWWNTGDEAVPAASAVVLVLGIRRRYGVN